MKINPNDPFFAAFSINEHGDGREQSGITIRQQFAMAAMQGMLSGHYDYFASKSLEVIPSIVSDYAVRVADALITELNKSEE